MLVLLVRTSSRRFRHASVTASRTWSSCSLGKYVPQKNGSRSGVISTVIGQPPCPVRAWVAAM
jgi:hypothetical protein